MGKDMEAGIRSIVEIPFAESVRARIKGPAIASSMACRPDAAALFPQMFNCFDNF